MDYSKQDALDVAGSKLSSCSLLTADNSTPIKTSSSSAMMSQHSGQITPPAKDYEPDSLIVSNPQIPGQLTPPATPRKRHSLRKKARQNPRIAKMAESTLAIIPFKGRYISSIDIGQGAWSKVHAAHLVSHEPVPDHPVSKLSPHNVPSLAVKTASHNMANPILKEEARILSHLVKKDKYVHHVIAFYGWEEETSGIILERACLDVTLASSIEAIIQHRTQEDLERRPFRSIIMEPTPELDAKDPVCGVHDWLKLADSLVSSLAWLHSHGVIHGDIKPANMLWTWDDIFVLSDFSSARIESESSGEALPTDAITTMYASPELLKSYSISNPPEDQSSRHATRSSDVWAMACTLVYAATGYDPYAFEKHRMRRILMAKDGCVIDSYINADDWRIGRKVRTGELVESIVRPALRKVVSKRITSEEWVTHIHEIANQFGLADLDEET